MILPDSPGPQSLKYVMLGDDASSTEEKLSKYKGTVNWEYLRPHYERGALFFVDPGLKLEEVGAVFSANDRAQVEAWLKAGDLVKISDLHAAQWQAPADVTFEALVVSPFVLCRPVTV
ncbi:MAG: DUF2288 domain-containing protein [Luteolibacter sp.]